MRTTPALLLTCSLLFGVSAGAAEHTYPTPSKMTVDANGDGMVSKAEFLQHHEKMWADMKKNADGSVAVKSMPMMGDHMAHAGTDCTPQSKSSNKN
jgi:hypothetical protein